MNKKELNQQFKDWLNYQIETNIKNMANSKKDSMHSLYHGMIIALRDVQDEFLRLEFKNQESEEK